MADCAAAMAARRDTAHGGAGSGTPPASGAAGWLSLAAAPAFAIMALLTGVSGRDAPDVFCPPASSPLGGMVPMYLLMSAFHSAPWLKLVCGRRRVNPH
jgi:hypothetical protein